ncbi:glycosyltransferase [Cesiribacter andamanensis]|uniref:GDP-mannose-dependent alpha-(1-6)-phosphatidylinositol monomannoside mannosyltransferase n=1 Tax=Cesiribacter andamanensis AMV16 TaxID=1279009 RepID=M7NIM4_9BACT|nr:glycosyltransferase [Cesiribacter andamanensis]EMR01625.1 GDP-mannose-dependent alpha-(1-6)-phosphatidylinositol monomannoside mannosyltransferase [Cesiribacter andamanensis AMV16]
MILFLSAYPPRESGLASYTHHLVQSFGEHFDPASLSVEVGALEGNNADKRLYGEEVRYVLNTEDAIACRNLAHTINQDTDIRAVCLQHRFGLWGGGRWGDHVLHFIEALEKPLAVMLHNVLPEPESSLKTLIGAISRRSDYLITHCRYHRQLLHQAYGIAADKLRVIAPGVEVLPQPDREALKEKYRLQGRLVLSSIGSLRRSKGLEQALEALDEIRKEHPSVIYLILGPTHGTAARHEGERYRFQIKDYIFRKGLQKHVAFVNRNLREEEQQDYLGLTDVYLHLSKNNTSGLLRAMSMGCPVIAAPSPITREFVPRQAGVVVEASCAGQYASLAKTFLSNPQLRLNKSRAARAATRQYYWPNVAMGYQDVFAEMIAIRPNYRLPALNADYLSRHTTSLGLKRMPAPAAEEGAACYWLEDNARALLASLQLYRYQPSQLHLTLLQQYLQLICHSQKPDGSFHARLDAQGRPLPPAGTAAEEEAGILALWALGALLASQQPLPEKLNTLARERFARALPQLDGLASLRSMSLAIKALHLYNQQAQDAGIRERVDRLASRLQVQYTAIATREWAWFEKGLSFANTLLPEALLLAWQETGQPQYKRTARQSFSFLLNFMFMEDPLPGTGSPVCQLGCEERFGFSNLPQDVAEAIMTLELFYEASGEELYLEKMRAAFSWFLGNNHLRQTLYNAATGSCCDGLESQGVRQRQGTENLVNYLLARLTLEKYARQHVHQEQPAPERKLAQEGGLAIAPDRPSVPSGNAKVVVK